MLTTTIIQAQVALLFLSLSIASQEESKTGSIAPLPVRNAVWKGIELYELYGGKKELRLPKALGEGELLTHKDIDEILDFFENTEIDKSKPGWGNEESPSVDWIRWQLMGGDAGWHWAKTTKELVNTFSEKGSGK